jgi:hypothetical protein
MESSIHNTICALAKNYFLLCLFIIFIFKLAVISKSIHLPHKIAQLDEKLKTDREFFLFLYTFLANIVQFQNTCGQFMKPLSVSSRRKEKLKII